MDSRIDTYKHIQTVQRFMGKVLRDWLQRAEAHDQSKLEDPEKTVFDEFTQKLATSTYGSEEYKGFLEAMKPALRHHYLMNPHHPEHFAFEFGEVNPQLVAEGQAIRSMSLVTSWRCFAIGKQPLSATTTDPSFGPSRSTRSDSVTRTNSSRFC